MESTRQGEHRVEHMQTMMKHRHIWQGVLVEGVGVARECL